MSNWEEIRKEWESTKITFKALAEKHGLKEGTLKSRRSREAWTRDATISKKMQPKKDEFKPVVESENLTEKQRLFCIYYIKYFNATKAYQKAYGCAYTTARVEGSRHLANPNINAEIDRLKAEQTHELRLDVRDILQKYIDIAFSDMTDYVEFGYRSTTTKEIVGVDDAGNPIINEETDSHSFVDLKDSNEVDGTIITEVKQGRGGISIKLADRMKALDMLSKYVDFLSDRDKKRLQEELLRMNIEKTKAEVDNLTDENKNHGADDWVAALNEVAQRRKVKNNE